MLRIDSTSSIALLGLAKIALEQEDVGAAQRLYEEILLSPPEAPDVRVVLADLAAILKHEDVARHYYEASLGGATVTDRDVWFKIGQLELARNALPAAREAFQNAIDQGRIDAETHRQLAAVLHALGQHPAAVEQYRA